MLKVSKRKLTNWRKEALKTEKKLLVTPLEYEEISRKDQLLTANSRVLELTQQILDQYLMEEK